MEEISVKLYLESGSDIRRFPFQVPSAGSDSQKKSASYDGIFVALFEKVKQIFPPNAQFSGLQLAWKDDEGDLIVMNTDDEVKEALRYRKGEIFRVVVRWADGAPQTDVAEGGKPAVNVYIGDDLSTAGQPAPEEKVDGKAGTNANTIHRGIICDVCDTGDIAGIRYKCLICPDYDLCATCEGTRAHDQHPVIRIANPSDRSWMLAFKIAQGGMNITRMHFHHSRGRRHGCSMQQNNESSQNGAEERNQEEQHGGPASEMPGVRFLRDVGQALVTVLNGIGIDVDIDAEHDGQRCKIATTKTEKEDETKVEKKQDEPANTTTVDQPMEPVASPPPAAAENVENVASPPQPAENIEIVANVTPDGQQDWMILDSADAVAVQQTADASAPKDSSADAAAAATATASAPPVSDAKIDEGLAYMTSMGFTNDGGWLTQLLKAKNGDVGAVLEILYPSNEKP